GGVYLQLVEEEDLCVCTVNDLSCSTHLHHTTMTVPIEAMYSRSRFPSGPILLFLLLYTPIGIIIFLLRLFISLQLFLAASVLPHNTIIRSLVCMTFLELYQHCCAIVTLE
ncbi:hypothetical protein OTU49_011426, partial [Cherax quadricarinatus]